MAGFFKKLVDKIQTKETADWDDLEANLIAGDLGVRLTLEIVDELRAKDTEIHADNVVEVTRARLRQLFPEDKKALERAPNGKPTVIIMVGVNGAGKTTSTAKMAKLLKDEGNSVLLAAADTFRAAAVEQLERWGERLDVPVVTGPFQSDPSSVCYQAHERAIQEKVDFLICDTAGRLHTRHNLMEELAKIRRTIAKQDESAPHHCFIVVDATTGGNALNQAKEFGKATALDGIVLTKLDGSGKGGVAAAIQNELGLAPRFVGTGEEPEEFAYFDREAYVEEIL